MKKLMAMLLALVCIFALAACGLDSPADEDLRGTISTAGDSKPAPSEFDEDKAEEKEFALGQTSNSTWENTYIGLGCKLPASWTFKTDKEIAELNGITQEFIPEDFADQMEKASVVYDMFAQSADEISNISVNLEKVTAAQLLLFDAETTLTTSMSVIKESYENMGFTNIAAKVEDIQVDGHDLKCLSLTASLGELTLHVKSFMVRCSGHVAAVSFVAPSAAESQQILDGIYWL